MSLYLNYLIHLSLTTYLGVILLRVYHSTFLYMNPLAAFTQCGMTFAITTVLIIIFALIQLRNIKSFEKAIKAGDRKKIIKEYNFFEKPLIVAETLGFVIGTGSSNLAEGLTGKVPFYPLLTVLIILHGASVGLMCYTVTLYRVKKLKMGDMLKKAGVTGLNFNMNTTLNISILACIFVTMMNFIMVPIGILLNPVENPIVVYVKYCAVSAVLNGTVCIVCYRMLINSIQRKDKEVKKLLFDETQNLAVATKESAATGQNQNAAIKEIVTTVGDSNSLNSYVHGKINDVSALAEKSKSDVSSGIDYFKETIASLLSNFDKSQSDTILEMQELDSKIDNIRDIVKVINDFADQAKIIAFNAELEASSAGKLGKNFHIVSTEVRRLSDNIIDSTQEIKERILEVQKASSALIKTGEEGKKIINESYDSVKDIESRFMVIKESSETTASSAEDIKSIMQQLSTASEQILITMKQISAGVENFSESTDNISSTSEKLKEIAAQM